MILEMSQGDLVKLFNYLRDTMTNIYNASDFGPRGVMERFCCM